MNQRQITSGQIAAFAAVLRQCERSRGTIEKYTRDIRAFAAWLGGREVTRECAAAWKQSLQERDYAPATVNAMLIALNRFFAFQGWQDCRVKLLKVQRRLFRSAEKDLSREEYLRLI